MSKETERLLTQQQTGEYVPTEQEEVLLESIQSARASRPQDGLQRPGPQFNNLRLNPLGEMRNEIVTPEAIEAGWGKTRFDRGEFTPGEDLENKRAIEQSGFSKILNGTMKGVVTALTTAAETTAGIINGLFSGTEELVRQAVNGDEKSLHTAVGRGVDNWTARTMADIQKLSEEWFPNYRTTAERSPEYQDNWMRHIFTANFIGDSFLKNLGFTAGALVGGAAWSKVLNAGLKAMTAGKMLKGVTAAAAGDAKAKEILSGVAKTVGGLGDVSVIADDVAIAKSFGQAAKGLNKLTTKHELFGGILAAMGEGTMEGVMARNEFMEDWGTRLKNEYADAYDALEQTIIDEEKAKPASTLIRVIPQFDENGNELEPRYELNNNGLKVLGERQRELAADYAEKRRWAENQGDRLAATTFLWNIPILTVSNTMQFGRMLSGGFKTARSNIAKVAGGITRDAGKLSADYAGSTANRALRVAARSLRNGAAEAAEEMAQGYISSGAKKVADDRLTSFNDDGYDRRVLADVGSWLSTMMEGGGEYLGDWKNWQEGFMGLATGLLGIPGRRWNGGILGARSEIREEDRMSQSAAEALNRRVNDEKFQEAWRGYVRHNKYDAQMEEAVNNDDHYAWATANDKQKISDIMMFANAGRLQDLYDVVDYYANMTDEQAEEKGVPEQTTTQQNQTQVQNNPSAPIEKVREQAKAIKDGIQMYSDMYDAMTTIAPIGTSDKQIQEMIATSMNIKALEERFLGMVNDVMTAITPQVEAVAEETKDIFERKEGITRAQQIYSLLLRDATNTGIPISMTLQDAIDSFISIPAVKQEVEATQDKNLIQKYDDLQKVARDRKRFLKKLVTLENLNPGDWDKQAEDADKVANDINNENANAATEGLETYDDIKKRYYDIETKKRPDFIDILRTKAASHEPTANFIKAYDTYQNFRETLAQNAPNIVDRNNGGFSNVAELMLEDAFEKATDEKSLLEAISNPISLDAVHEGMRRRVEAGTLDEDEAFPPLVNQQYAAAEQAIKAVAEQFKNSSQNTQGRENLQKQKKAAPQTPSQEAGDNDNDNPPASTRPTANQKTKQQDTRPAENSQEGQPAVSSQETNDNPESREKTDSTVGESDSNASYTDNTPSEDESYLRDRNGTVKLGYYQQTLPEVPINTMVEIRRLLEDRKGADREQMRAIDALLYSINRDDFVQFDSDGNPIAGEVDYAPVFKWLKDQGAFEYISNNLSVNDELVFAIPKNGPEYDGEKLIVVSVVTGRNSDGDITSIQPLTTLHSSERSGQYMYLDELYDAIRADYESQPVGGDLYVFGGLRKPKTSKVFAKQPGIMRYNHSEGGQRIDKIPSYDSSSPMIILDDNNKPVVLRGNPDLSKVFLPLVYDWSTPHNGRVYYLVKNGKDSYTPVFVDKVGVTSEMIRNAADGSFLSDVRGLMQKMDTLLQGATVENMQVRNDNLHKGINRIAEYVNLDGISFDFVQTPEGVKLHVEWGKGESEQMDFNPGDTVLPIFDSTNIPVRLSTKSKWLGASRRNLDRIIQDGLLTSDVRELRQVGVNMLYDPWNPETGKFERVLPSIAQEPKQSVPKAGPQKIAADAEMGETMQDILPIAPRTFKATEPVSTETEVSTLDDLFGDDNEEVPEYQLDYEDLSEATKKLLEQKQVSEKTWNARDDAFRKHVLNC